MVKSTTKNVSSNGTNNVASKKTECPISREQFLDNATALEVVIAGQTLMVEAREFSTGSIGWFLSGKLNVKVDGVVVKVQCGITCTVIGSKELPQVN